MLGAMQCKQLTMDEVVRCGGDVDGGDAEPCRSDSGDFIAIPCDEGEEDEDTHAEVQEVVSTHDGEREDEAAGCRDDEGEQKCIDQGEEIKESGRLDMEAEGAQQELENQQRREAEPTPESSVQTEHDAVKIVDSEPPPVVPDQPLRAAQGVTFVDDGSQIARDLEVFRLVRRPRYFDADMSDPTLSTRCFNCGGIGHRSNACTNSARQKPCYLCAQFAHDAKECPAQLCFKCGHPGHKSRECTQHSSRDTSWEMGQGRCLRCASSTCPCANKADYYRYEGGCSESYSPSDLARCKCYVCGQFGHLCCKLTPRLPARVTCYSCGSSTHLGEECPTESRSHLAAERAGDMRRARQEREDEMERANERAARNNQGWGGRSRQPEQPQISHIPAGMDPWLSDLSDRDRMLAARANDSMHRAGPIFNSPAQHQRMDRPGIAAGGYGAPNYPGSLDRAIMTAKRPRVDGQYREAEYAQYVTSLQGSQPVPLQYAQVPLQYAPGQGVYPVQPPFVFGQPHGPYASAPAHATFMQQPVVPMYRVPAPAHPPSQSYGHVQHAVYGQQQPRNGQSLYGWHGRG